MRLTRISLLAVMPGICERWGQVRLKRLACLALMLAALLFIPAAAGASPPNQAPPVGPGCPAGAIACPPPAAPTPAAAPCPAGVLACYPAVNPTAIPTFPGPPTNPPECGMNPLNHPLGPLLGTCVTVPMAPRPAVDPRVAAHKQAQSFMGQLVPDESGSTIPLSSYDIGYSTSLSKGLAPVWGLGAGLCFAVSTWLVAIGLWVLNWAYGFSFVSAGGQVAADMGSLLQTRILGPLGLGAFALLLCAACAAWQFARGRTARGAREIVTTLLVLALASFVLADPAGLLRSAVRLEGQSSGAILSLASNSPQDPAATTNTPTSTALAPLRATIVSTLVAGPYDLINWGSPLTGRCAAIRNEALAMGPWGDDDTPRQVMAQAPECAAAATFNGNPTVWRFLSAVLQLLTALISLIVLILMGVAVMSAQFIGLLLIALLPLAVLAGLLPGGARSLAWRWVEGAIKALLAVVVVSFLLAFWSLAVTAILSASSGQPLMVPFLSMLVTTAAMILILRRSLKGVGNVSRHFGSSLQSGRPWVPSGGSGRAGVSLGLGVGALELASLYRRARRMTPHPLGHNGGGADLASPAPSGKRQHLTGAARIPPTPTVVEPNSVPDLAPGAGPGDQMSNGLSREALLARLTSTPAAPAWDAAVAEHSERLWGSGIERRDHSQRAEQIIAEVQATLAGSPS